MSKASHKDEKPKAGTISWKKGRKSITRTVLKADGTTETVKQARLETQMIDGIRLRKLPSGSWRVEVPRSTGEGWKQFRDLADAKAHAAQVAAAVRRGGTESFNLDPKSRIDALEASELLDGTATLAEAARFYMTHHRPAGGDITLADAVERFLTTKEDRENMRERSLKDLRNRLARFADAHGETLLKSITQEQVSEAVHIKGWSDQTKLNEWRVLHSFFSWAVKNKFVASNPVARVDRPRATETEPEVLTVNQCRSLLQAAHAHPELKAGPYVALGLFAGIRTAELDRLSWDAVRLGEGFITIGSDVAKKRKIRNVTLCPAAMEWLKAYGTKRAGRIVEPNHRKNFAKLLSLAGIDHWPHNGMRHTFGSCHYAAHDNANLTASQLGHTSDAVLFDHYRALTTKADAQAFFALRPPTPEGNIVTLSATA